MFKVMESEDLQSILPSKAITWNQRADPRKEKAKGVHHHQTNIVLNVKGSSLRTKKWKNMDNKIIIDIYLSTVESKKQKKQAQ